ncbi:MAG: ABC transporter ATP-binding protein [Alicyclobacillus sp.]|nr:ABC transporter ATP-binding protein [Alicyclobacillus sp.]
MLQIEDLHVMYGKVHAVKGVSLHVEEGEMVSLLGANGAGKSSVLKTICGLVKPASGTIRLAGKDVTRVKAHRLVQEGIGYVPEGRRIYPVLTVKENLLIGAYHRRDKAGIQADLARVYEYFPVLRQKADVLAGNLSGGQQQMLAVGRALLSRPRFLLLDEPSMGLAPSIVQQIFEILKTLHQQGMTMLLVEQNAYSALSIADRAYVLETGRVALAGPAAELKNNDQVRQIYLGM